MIQSLTLAGKLRRSFIQVSQLGYIFVPLGLSILSVAAGQTSHKAQSDNLAPVMVTIGDHNGMAISPTFMGISHEWGDAQTMMGDSRTGVNVIYRNLLTNLLAYGSGPLVIRIGGNSTDTSKGTTSTTVLPFAELAADTGAHFYLGVNLGGNDVHLAVAQAKAFVGAMPPHSLDAIEIGNEPDSFVDKGMRSAPYSFQTYLGQFDTWRKQIYPLLPVGTGVLGPSWAYPASLSNVSQFLAAEHSYLNAVSQHLYIGNACKGNINPADILLRPNSASVMPQRMRGAVVESHAYHVPFRVDELNSIACGGQDGLSNTFGAALWAIDIMFEFANMGVDGVNWQSPNGAAYSLMNFNIVKSGNNKSFSIKSVTPLYYGLLFFQTATGKRSHLVPVSSNADASLKTWAARDANGKLRLVLINKGGAASSIRIVGTSYHNALILRLGAPSPSSKVGVRFAGQTIDGSVDGKLQGAKEFESVSASSKEFRIAVGSAEALIVEFIN